MKLSEVIITCISTILGTGTIWKVITWINERKSKKISNVFVKENNLFACYQNGDTKQLTSHNSDKFPLLSKKESRIIFFRAMNPTSGQTDFNEFKIMSINFKNFSEETITDQKPFPAGSTLKFEIIHPRSPVLSDDQRSIFFVIEKYVTASTLVQVEIKSGKWTELFSVEAFDIIASGKYKGKFLVGYSDIGPNGRQMFYKVCEHNGATIKKLDNEIEYRKFRSLAMIRE